LLFIQPEAEDECSAVSTFYDCGAEKMPNVTKTMVEQGKGSSVVVINFSFDYYFILVILY
jgi:hypothetical protein